MVIIYIDVVVDSVVTISIGLVGKITNNTHISNKNF